MIILGLDCDSAKIGYAYFKDEKLFNYGVLKSFDSDIGGRQFELFSKLHELFEQCKPDKVIMEQSFYSNNFKTSRAITEIIGNSKIVCQLFDISFDTIQVTQWKKMTVGKGNCDKNSVLQYVVSVFNVDNTISQDSADAIAIAYSGVLNENGRYEQTKREDIGSIKKTRRKRRNKNSGES